MPAFRTTTLALAILAGVACAAAQPQPMGRFMDRGDSLGYDEYRALPADEQLELRDEARRWLRRADDASSFAEALDATATAVGHCPYLAIAWMRYAEMHHRSGQYAIAQHCLEQVGRTLRFEARKSERRETEEEWRALGAEVAYNLGQLDLCVSEVDEALLLRENDGELMLLKARALGDLGEYASARSILRQFEQNDPLYAHSLHVLGNVDLAAGRLNQSEDAFARAAKYGRRGPIFLNDRGRLALAREDPDEAAGYFRDAIGLLPSFMEARCNLAISLRRQSRLDDAISELEAVVDEQESYGPAQFHLAESYRQRWQAEGEPWGERALGHYSEALRFGYDSALTTQRRAELALQLNRLGDAEEDLLRMSSDPTVDPSILHLLARVKKDQGELRIAAQLLAMARERGLDSAELYSDMGEVQLREGRAEEAVESLRLALRRNDDLITTRVNLSIAYVVLEDLDAADEVLREAEARQPEHDGVVAQRAALSEAGVPTPR